MIYLDRQLSSLNPAVGVAFAGGDTTWTLPFSIPVDGSEGILVLASGDEAIAPVGTIFSTTRPAPNQIRVVGQNLSIFEMFLGVVYTMDVKLSTLYPRTREGKPDTRGKLQLRNIEVEYSKTGRLVAAVHQPDRDAVLYAFTSDVEEEGELRVPLLGNNEHTSVVLTSDSALGCRLTGAAWEGFLHVRNFPR